jgi:FKBP-type peptidyl-prolyl cis-trans isomerase SlyD
MEVIMKVGPGTIVLMDYSLYLKSGELIATTEGKSPIEFEFGKGEILSALEERIEGMEVGEKREIVLTPEEGFGNIDYDAIIDVPRNNFPEDIELKEGMTFSLKREDGKVVPFTIRGFKEDKVTIDFNHPLAGKTLRFVVSIVDVKSIT